MNRVPPHADVRGYEARIADVTLPDPDDRHVLAAAMHAGASVVVTLNTRDFPAGVLGPLGIEAQSPDELLRGLNAGDPDLMCP